MQTVKELVDQIKQKQADIDQINQRTREINNSIQEMETKLAMVRARDHEIDKRLANASKDIAFGRLSTDELLELKREKHSIEGECKIFQEAIEEQKNTNEILKQELFSAREYISYKKIAAFEEFSRQLLNEMADDDKIKRLIYAYFACQDHRRFPGRPSQFYMYQEFGAKLVNEAFMDHSLGLSAIPTIQEAREKVYEFITDVA